MAINAKEQETIAGKALSNSVDELEATEIVQQKLIAEIEELDKIKSSDYKGVQNLPETANSVFETVDLKEQGMAAPLVCVACICA